jgi:outer membrane protein assembly factor BamB
VLMVSPASGQVVSESTFPERLNELMFVDDRLFGLSSGSVRAVNLDTGATLWSSSFPTGFRPLDTSDLYENIFDIAWDYSSIVYEGQHVLVNLITTEAPYPLQDHQAMLLALNAADGTESWRFSYDLPTTLEGGLATWPVLIGSTRGVVFLAAGTLYALDSNSGEAAWRIENDFEYSPWQAAVVGDGVLVTREGCSEIVSIDMEQGAVVWTHEVPDCVRLLQLSGDEVVLLYSTHGMLEGVELASGQSSWIWEPPRDQLCHRGDIIDFELSEGRLYIATPREICVYRFNDR